MAHHDLPAVFRGGRDLLRFRDGADPLDPAPGVLRARGLHHDAAPREHGQGPDRDGADRRLRLRGRALHGVVQRQSRGSSSPRTAFGPTGRPTGRSSSATSSRCSSSGSEIPRDRGSSGASRSSSTSGCGSALRDHRGVAVRGTCLRSGDPSGTRWD
jgi:hypothetical protein